MKKGQLCYIGGTGGMILSVSSKQVVVMLDGGQRLEIPRGQAENKVMVYEDFSITKYIGEKEAETLDKLDYCQTSEDAVNDAGANIHREDDDSNIRPYLTKNDFKNMFCPFDDVEYEALVDFIPAEDEVIALCEKTRKVKYQNGFKVQTVVFEERLLKSIEEGNTNDLIRYILGRDVMFLSPAGEVVDSNNFNFDVLKVMGSVYILGYYVEEVSKNDDAIDALSYAHRLLKEVDGENLFGELKKAQNKTESGDFIKADDGKVMMSLVEPEFVKGIAKILTMGAKKYAMDNWKLLDPKDIYRYKDACLRHLYAYLGGEFYDQESGMPHLWHVATNLMFLDWFEKNRV